MLALAGACLVPWESLYASTEFWDKKDPSQWTGEEIDRLTTKSPWAKSVSAQASPKITAATGRDIPADYPAAATHGGGIRAAATPEGAGRAAAWAGGAEWVADATRRRPSGGHHL